MFTCVNIPHKCKIEANRQLEVQLNGGTLVIPADGIFYLNINLNHKIKHT